MGRVRASVQLVGALAHDRGGSWADTADAAGTPSAGRARLGEDVPTTTPSARAALLPACTVLIAVGALLAFAVALAGPAAAIEDPRRPTVEVTHGPSCGPAV